jgi:hypothetical protein
MIVIWFIWFSAQNVATTSCFQHILFLAQEGER